MERSTYSDLPPAQRMKLLRDAVLAAQSAAAPVDPVTFQELNQQLDHLVSRLATARDKAAIKERPFTSGVPVLGGLIVRARTAWNWMSTKWWVRPLVEQQNDFNQEMLSLLGSALHAVRASALAMNQLAAACAAQHAELSQLRSDVKVLQSHLGEPAPLAGDHVQTERHEDRY